MDIYFFPGLSDCFLLDLSIIDTGIGTGIGAIAIKSSFQFITTSLLYYVDDPIARAFRREQK